MTVVRWMTGAQVYSVVRWLLGCGLVGLLVVLIVPLFLSSVRAWLLRLRAVFDFAPAHLPAADPVLHMSAPVRRCAVADARLGLA